LNTLPSQSTPAELPKIQPPAIARVNVDSARLKEQKTIAKLLESMSPEDAAKILQKMDDKQVKAILFSVKKRQAGKILASLEPQRVARMMR
jgi:flagellar motility protein MotE (MotC chaperone)